MTKDSLQRVIYIVPFRSQGMGLLQISGRIGSASAPWVAKGLRPVHHAVPFLVMGVSSFIAAALMLLLPETKGKSTAEAIYDREDQGEYSELEFLKASHDRNLIVNHDDSDKDESTKL